MGGWLKYVVEEVSTVCCKRQGSCDLGPDGWAGPWGRVVPPSFGVGVAQVCIKFFLMHTSGLGLGSKLQADPKPGPRETSIMNISRVWGQIKASIMSIIPSSPSRSAAGAGGIWETQAQQSKNSANPSTTEAKTVQTTLHKTSRIPKKNHEISTKLKSKILQKNCKHEN